MGTVHKQIIVEQNTQRPNRITLGLVKAAAVSGEFALNSFKFARYVLNHIELQIDRLYCKLASMLDSNESGNSFGVTAQLIFLVIPSTCTVREH